MLMRLATATLIAAAAILPAAIPAEAANPPRVNGESCSKLKAQLGKGNVWQTSFVGQRLGMFDELESYHAAPCFRSQANCKAWLYWAQTDWNRYQYFTPCKKGIR